MNPAQQLVEDLQYLESVGLTNAQLRSLHHWSSRPEAAGRVSFASARRYFSKEQKMQENNAAFAERVRMVADLHRRGLNALIDVALSKHPL